MEDVGFSDDYSSGNQGVRLVLVSLGVGHAMRGAFVNRCGRRAIDQQAEQLRPAVMAARVHQLLSLVDQREVEVGDHHAFAGANGLSEQASVGCRDRREATTGDRTDAATRNIRGRCRLAARAISRRGADSSADADLAGLCCALRADRGGVMAPARSKARDDPVGERSASQQDHLIFTLRTALH